MGSRVQSCTCQPKEHLSSKVQPLSGNQRPDLLTSLMNMVLVLRLPCKMPLCRSSACGSFNILTWKFASRHNGVHFFDISTSKSDPTLRWFARFDLEMCFAPQPRPLFRHLNFQKCSDTEVLCAFWLGKVLRATSACTFSTSQLPKVPRTWSV